MRASSPAVLDPLRSIRRRLRTPRSPAPSYRYKTGEMRRGRQLDQQLGLDHPVWQVNDKDAAHAWADGLGIPRPGLLGVFASVGQVPFAQMPEAVVLKPSKGASAQGVLLLERAGAQLRELRSGRLLSPEQVRREYSALVGRGNVSEQVVIEELVQDPRRPGLPPVDWKVYTFDGQVGLVLAKAPGRSPRGRPTTGWRLFDGSWADLGDVYRGHRPDRSIRPPEHADEVLSLARRISCAVPRPFLRVDLYDGRDGVVFGELTPHPGGAQRFSRRVDRMLGVEWERAEARLRARVQRAGGFEVDRRPGVPAGDGAPVRAARRVA